MPIICFLTFFLSSIIDNLTSTIVAVKILRRLTDNKETPHETRDPLPKPAATSHRCRKRPW